MASDKKTTRKTIGRFGSRERHQIESDGCFRNIGILCRDGFRSKYQKTRARSHKV